MTFWWIELGIATAGQCGSTKIAVALTPLPNPIYLILDAEDDIILNRKNELAPEELRRQRKAYANLAPNSRIQV